MFRSVCLHETIDCLDQRRNSFTFLRLTFAVLVLLSHSYSLGGFGKDLLYSFSNGQSSLGSVAVDGFFIISGFMVTYSYLNTTSIWRYLWHRILRVFPGYWVCLLVTALIIGAIIHYCQHGNYGYFRSYPNNPLTYIKANLWLTIEQRSIGDLLAANPYPNDFNGSLWVLRHLALCYLILAAFGLLGLLKKHKAILVGLFLCLWAANIFEQYVINTGLILLPKYISFKVPQLLVYFLAGSVFVLQKKRIPFHYSLALAAAGLTLLSWRYGFYNIMCPVLVPYIVIWLAIKLPFKGFDKLGDYSYGIYVYAFPIQQMLCVVGLHNYGKFVYFSVSLLLAMVSAVGSWWLIEKPCLGMKSISMRHLLLGRAYKKTKLAGG